MKTTVTSPAAFLFFLFLMSIASAQRGVGDPQGVARQPAKPKLVVISGDVLEVKTEPCSMTTGRSQLGTHLIIKTADAKTVNIHLGPARAVEFAAKQLARGQDVRIEAFRTEKTAKGQFVARSLTIDGKTLELRDKDLRPKWAGQEAPNDEVASIVSSDDLASWHLAR